MRKFIFGYGFFVLLCVGILVLFDSCKKEDNFAGVPLPFDIPTSTPTPIVGSINVMINDSGNAIGGIAVNIISPASVTLGPSDSQNSGIAAFNPSSIVPGIWTAFIPAQSVTFISSLYSSSITYLYYFYNSSVTFNVSATGQGSATFSTGGNSISFNPVSISFSTAYPTNFPITASYNQNGNLNLPVSCSVSLSSPLSGITVSPISFVFGEGVTQQAVTISKASCYSQDIIATLSATDFVGKSLTSAPATLYKNFPVSIVMRLDDLNDVSFFTTNDCSVSWNYSFDDVGQYPTHFSSGSATSGVTIGPFTDNTSGAIFQLSLSSPMGTFTGQFNQSTRLGANYGPVTFYNSLY